MSGQGVEAAVEQIRVDEGLARQVAEEGIPALDDFDLTAEEATAVVDALRLDLGAGPDEVAGFSLSWGMPLDNLIGVGRRFGVQDLGGGQSAGWIESAGGSEAGWIERPGRGGLVS